MSDSSDSTKTLASSTASPSLTIAKELLAGTVGGTAQICVGHPFDTVKVKMQSMPVPKPGQPAMYSGAFDVVRQVMRTEGVRGLYAGIQAPLPFVAVFNATLFASNGAMRQLIGRGRSDDQLTLPEVGLAGVGAGVAVSFVACPTELVKCRLQAQPGVFAGAIDCTRQVVAARGMSGLYTGMYATMAREMVGNSFYFMAYAATLDAMSRQKSKHDLSAPQFMLAGGMAGLAFWIPCYPLDYCKTLLQTDSEVKPRYRGLLDCMRQTIRTGGFSAMYKGVGPCIARAFPANAVTFLAYEWTKRQFSG